MKQRNRATQGTLPQPAQLAQIAAGLLRPNSGRENCHLDAAIKDAARLYLRAEAFCREHASDKAVQLALATGDGEAYTRDLMSVEVPNWPQEIPRPDNFPAKLKDFYRVVVKADTAECSKRFRHFLFAWHQSYRHPLWLWTRKLCPDNRAEAKAIKLLEKITDADKREGYFTEGEWLRLARCYLEWWSKEKSRKASESAKKRKSAT
jgi:hypothetical protein